MIIALRNTELRELMQPLGTYMYKSVPIADVS